ncbi:hypothetical protein H4R18_001512 [Coemansia javaensis]|uniref:PAS domain-containing protein n=1 Tax=Coemansia javaensis TaxID=2761396 RepID=A0A9W8HFE3_9FUNG|nr:hypothetical protein H4R18_001512 [Coemansia javaensis]
MAGHDPPADGPVAPHHPTYVGIHSVDDTTELLYISSGSTRAIGFTPEYLLSMRAKDFIADDYDPNDYPRLYDAEADGSDEGGVFVFYTNVRTAHGPPVLHKITSFKCGACVLYVGTTYPEVPFRERHELRVQALDRAMTQRNITREQQARRAAKRRNAPVYRAHSGRAKAAFVLEHPTAVAAGVRGPHGRQAGVLISFATASLSHVIDADPSDVIHEPFLKLVAPEDLVRVSAFFDRLAASTEVLFESFALLQRPHLIDGDVIVADEDNKRVVVDCLGAASHDGLVLLVNKLRTKPAPARDTLGNYVRAKVREVDDEGGYLSLAELLSSDPETSDAPGWAQLDMP